MAETDLSTTTTVKKPSVLQSVNKNGSGMDLAAVVTALVDAETVPQRVLTERSKEAIETSISAYGTLKGKVSDLKTNLTSLEASSGRLPFSDSSKLFVSVLNEAQASDFVADVTISQLATGQVQSFDLNTALGSGSAATAAIGTGTITINATAWTDAQTVTINNNNNTVEGLKNALNELEGIGAEIIDTGSGVKLLIKSETGGDNALAITTTANLSVFRSDAIITPSLSINSLETETGMGTFGVTLSNDVLQVTGDTAGAAGDLTFNLAGSGGTVVPITVAVATDDNRLTLAGKIKTAIDSALAPNNDLLATTVAAAGTIASSESDSGVSFDTYDVDSVSTARASISGGEITIASAASNTGAVITIGSANVTLTADAAANATAITNQFSAIGITATAATDGRQSNGGVDLSYAAFSASTVTFSNKVEGDNLAVSQTRAAQDAIMTVDGVSVTRSSNVIEDLYPGHQIILTGITAPAANGTPAESFAIGSTNTNDASKTRFKEFLAHINELKAHLNEVTDKGIMGGEVGGLAGDTAAQTILRRLSGFTTMPIPGFATDADGNDDPVYLAEMGVRTMIDGSLELFDEDAFDAALAANPDVLDPIFNTKFSSSSAAFSMSGFDWAPPDVGSYAFSYTHNDSTGSGTATLNGVNMTASIKDGITTFQSATSEPTDPTYGIRVTVLETSGTTASMRYGVSLLDTIKTYTSDLLGFANAFDDKLTLADREVELRSDVTDADETLAEIEAKVTELTDRYNTQFAAMEAAVTGLNATGEYMTTLFDSWNNQKN